MMRISALLYFVLLFSATVVRSQAVMYSEPFTSSLNSCTASNSANGAWVWANSCLQSTVGSHTQPGHAMFQGSGCQFGNGGNTVSGNLVTPTIAITQQNPILTFKYALKTECGGGTSTTEIGTVEGPCTYDAIKVEISNNNGSTYSTVLSSNGIPGGMGFTNGWVLASYSLTSYASQTIIVRFNFNSLDGIANNYDGVYVDDILISGCGFNAFASAGTGTTAPTICPGSSIVLTSNAVGNYSWNTGAVTPSITVSPTVNTSYTLTATSSASCNAYSVVQITVLPGPPTPTILPTITNICPGAPLILTAVGADSYSWTGGVSNGVSFVPPSSGIYTVTGYNQCGSGTATIAITVAPMQVTAMASNSVLCAGQSALLSASAAATSYTWLPMNTSNNSGTVLVYPQVSTLYTVIAVNGPCSATANVYVVSNPNPTITLAADATIVCQGSPVTLTAGGGTTYTWTPGNLNTSQVIVQPTTATLYSVGATSSLGCTSGSNIAILTKPIPVVGLSANPTLLCLGKNATLTANGANSYSWSTGDSIAIIVVTPAAGAVYSVTGSTNGCSATKTILVNVFTPALTIGGDTALCEGMTGTLTGLGANTYTWLPPFPFQSITVTPSVSTIYSLTATSHIGALKCVSSATALVVVNFNPTVAAVANKQELCKSEAVIFTASGANTYSWSNGKNTPNITVIAGNNSVIVFSVQGIDANGCSNVASAQVKVNACTGLAENEIISAGFFIYPNPAKGDFMISSEKSISLVIVNELGQIMRNVILNEFNSYRIEVTDLSPGIYFVKPEGYAATEVLKVVVDR